MLKQIHYFASNKQRIQMNYAQLYLPTVLPQWGIFVGIILITFGYVEKKVIWTYLGWATLLITGIIGLYFNLLGNLSGIVEKQGGEELFKLIISANWQLAAGGLLALLSLVLFYFKTKRYPILAILTLLYFVLIFFLYTQIASLSGKLNSSEKSTEIKK